MTDTWNPAQYDKFQREREQPFHDLLAMVEPSANMRAADLGCGSGRLTRLLHEQLHARETVGVDRSPRMLEAGAGSSLPAGLIFEVGTIESFPGGRGKFDLIFSNAALHWVDDHPSLLARLANALNSDGQLAFQVPAEHDEATHIVADELADSEPFRSALAGWRRTHAVMTPKDYARTLYRVGFHDPQVRLIVYPHVLDSAGDVVEWMKGTLLTDYQRRLPADLFERFVERYRDRLLERLDDGRPYFFPFKRILCRGRRYQ